MTEGELQTKFTGWLKEHGKQFLRQIRQSSIAYELKVVTGFTLAFSKIEEHQVLALAKAAGLIEGVLCHKISDSAIGVKPFDGFVMGSVRAFIGVGYDGGREFYLVPVEKVLARYTEWAEGGRVKRERLTVSEAREWGLRLW